MKKFLFFISVFFTFQFTQAQSESKESITIESISKKWVFSDLINQKFSKEEYEETKDLLSATEIVFRKDKTFTFSFIADLDGTWELNKNVITTKDRKGVNTWTIHKLSSNEIIMSRNDSHQKMIFKSN
jgi:hypothetical protein